jgi:hypothetical protein
VVNQYFKVYFPRAIQIANELANSRFVTKEHGLVYTTHAYLVSLYLDCPVGMGYYCPNKGEISEFKKAVQNGYIRWHAFPFNAEVELMHPNLFEFSLEMSRNLTREFVGSDGLPVFTPTVMSQRDVPGMTQAAIPLLKKHGIVAISVGAHGASMPADVPPLFKWRFGTDEILVAYHPRGYGGYGKTDCVEAVLEEIGVKKVFCTAFRGDNAGPPQSSLEVDLVYVQLGLQYPGANITSVGGFEGFFEAVVSSSSAMSSLPVVTQEMGDTWIYGVASDPLKLAAFRAIQRVWKPREDVYMMNFTRQFIKNYEHTWGGDLTTMLDAYLSPEYYYWSNQDFDNHRSEQKLSALEATWMEERLWGFDFPLAALPENDPFKNQVLHELKELFEASTIPNLDTFKKVNASSLITVGKFTLGFNTTTGAVDYLKRDDGVALASSLNTIGELWYQTFTEQDLVDYMNDYLTCNPNAECSWALLNFGKKGLASADPERLDIIGTLESVYQAEDSVWVEVSFPEALQTKYGAPSRGLIGYEAEGDSLAVQVIWDGKRSTRMAESIAFRFNPLSTRDQYVVLDKLGSEISIFNDQSSVMNNGSQHLHGVLSGVKLVQPSAKVTVTIESLDSTVVNLGLPTPFPTGKYDLLDGLSFNLFNNIWGTNYIMWYPFKDSSILGQAVPGSTQGFRFKILITKN